MKSNIDTLDRYVRLASGLILLGSAASMRRRTPVLVRGTLLAIGAMKVAEGTMGWCPLVYLMERMNRQPFTGAGASNQDQALYTNGQPPSGRPASAGRPRQRRRAAVNHQPEFQ